MTETRTAAVAQWRSYLVDAGARRRDSRFLVHGRAITTAVQRGWPLETLIYRVGYPALPTWAHDILAGTTVPQVGLVADRMAELADPSGDTPDLIAVAHMADMLLSDFAPSAPAPVVVVVAGPQSPSWLGATILAAQAFSAAAVLVAGGVDQYDPRCMQACGDSLFAVPLVRVARPAEVVAWRDQQVRSGRPTCMVGVVDAQSPHSAAGPLGELNAADAMIVVLGGVASAWRNHCDTLVRLPVATSLPTACEASVVLYEIARQRGALQTVEERR